MKLRSKLFYSYLVFVIVYSAFTLLPRPSPATLQQYDIGVMGLRIMSLMIVILVAAIWYVGFYGNAGRLD